MVKLVTGGGSDLSPDMQKIVAKLEQLLKGGKKLDIGIDELKKKAGVFCSAKEEFKTINLSTKSILFYNTMLIVLNTISILESQYLLKQNVRLI